MKSTERFGEDVRILQWRFGTTRCRNDVVILLSQSNKQVGIFRLKGNNDYDFDQI